MKCYSKYLCILWALFFCFVHHDLSAQALGNGKDGSENISGVINLYAYLIRDVNPCKGLLYVNQTTGFKPNDLICIVQMQGAQIKSVNDSTYGEMMDEAGAGDFEFAIVDSVSSNSILCKHVLLHAYRANANTQVIRVPQYQNADVTGTLTCPEWNGKTGGVLIVDALGDVSLHADINVMGKGFRGGVSQKGQHTFDVKFEYIAEVDPNYYSRKGEGIAGYGVFPFIAGRGAPANAGGGGNIHTTGGGGGGNVGKGGDGGWGYPVDNLKSERRIFGVGGYSLGSSASGKIFAGGGGGAGHEHFGNGTNGGSGGGILIINSNQIFGNGHAIYAQGSASAPSGAFGDGTGGAGAGGTISLSCGKISSALNIYANGGEGGSSVMKGFGPGGGGGGGRIQFSAASLPINVLKAEVFGGSAGFAGGAFYGAKDGGNGNTLFQMGAMHIGKNPVTHAAFSYTMHSISSLNFINQSKSSNNSYWDFNDLQFATTRSPMHNFEKPGLYEVQLIAENGVCRDTVTHQIFSGLPDVITPNGDGVNDAISFQAFAGENLSIEFMVFNRWGQKVWEATSPNTDWEGKDLKGRDLPAGVYFITFKIPENGVFKGIDYNTSITLLR